MSEPQQFIWKLIWHPKGAHPKTGEVFTCVRDATLTAAIGRLFRHYQEGGVSYCVLVGAEMVGEWLLEEASETETYKAESIKFQEMAGNATRELLEANIKLEAIRTLCASHRCSTLGGNEGTGVCSICQWLGQFPDELAAIAREPRYCVKCGIKTNSAAHVLSCDGPGNAAQPAPFKN